MSTTKSGVKLTHKRCAKVEAKIAKRLAGMDHTFNALNLAPLIADGTSRVSKYPGPDQLMGAALRHATATAQKLMTLIALLELIPPDDMRVSAKAMNARADGVQRTLDDTAALIRALKDVTSERPTPPPTEGRGPFQSMAGLLASLGVDPSRVLDFGLGGSPSTKGRRLGCECGQCAAEDDEDEADLPPSKREKKPDPNPPAPVAPVAPAPAPASEPVTPATPQTDVEATD